MQIILIIIILYIIYIYYDFCDLRYSALRYSLSVLLAKKNHKNHKAYGFSYMQHITLKPFVPSPKSSLYLQSCR